MLELEVAQVLRRAATRAVHGLVVVARDRQFTPLLCQEPCHCALGKAQVLVAVREHEREAAGQPSANVRLLVQQPEGVQREVADVERAGLGQQSIVRGVDVRELELALCVRALVVGRDGRRAVLGPAAEVLGSHHLLLQLVDALDEPRQKRRRVAADLVAAQRQVVDPLEQQRQPVGGADGREQRVEAGLERLVAQDPLAQLLCAEHRQLLVGRVDQRLDPRSQVRRGGARRRDHQHAAGRERPPRQATRRGGRSRASCPCRAAEYQQRAAAMGDGRLLCAIEAVQRSGHPV